MLISMQFIKRKKYFRPDPARPDLYLQCYSNGQRFENYFGSIAHWNKIGDEKRSNVIYTRRHKKKKTFWAEKGAFLHPNDFFKREGQKFKTMIFFERPYFKLCLNPKIFKPKVPKSMNFSYSGYWLTPAWAATLRVVLRQKYWQ